MSIIAFLGVDIRDRDARDRMLEIMDSRPFSNVALVFGRFLGMFLAAWIPVVILMLIIQILGLLLPLLGMPIGGLVDPLSIVGFVVYMTAPALALSCSLVMLMTIALRQRFIALVLAASIIFILLSVIEAVPFGIALSLDLFGTMQLNQSSEWIPSIANLPWWLQRLGIVLLAVGLLCFTVIIHPRLDSARGTKRWISAFIFTLGGVGLISGAYEYQRKDFSNVAIWQSAHENMRKQVNPDILTMQAQVDIEPGKNLSVEVDIEFKAPKENSIEKALFSLNPGIEIRQVTNAKGDILSSSHQAGLLQVSLDKKLAAGEQTSIKVIYQGKPDVLFGYLDSAINMQDRTEYNGSRELMKLGSEKGIFDQQYVALMPGIHWLPSSGVDVGRDDIGSRQRDFYQLDLTVQLPNGWIPAGPGLRKTVNGSNTQVEFNFSPANPISEVAILAAPFSVFSTEIDEIVFELLLHPKHSQIVDDLALGRQELEKWVKQKLSLIKDAGLEYPFKAFTLVEVPNSLREYAGGWSMDTALAPPSMVLLKEKGLPTARFDVTTENSVLSDVLGWSATPESEDDEAKILRNRLINYFSNDFSSSSLYSGFTRSIFSLQTSAKGKEAIALNYAMSQLAAMVISGERSYFSVESQLSIDRTLNQILQSNQQPHKTITEQVIAAYTSRINVWESSLATSLSDMDPWKSPQTTIDVLALKSGQLAEIIYDTLGAQGAGELLSQLLDKYRGTSYSLDDVAEILRASDPGLDLLLEDWFNSRGIAGFTTDQVKLNQLSDTEKGDVRYQLTLRLKNEELATGFTQVSWTTEIDGRRTYSDPIRLAGKSALEFGLVLTKPPINLHIEPYLSLNRKEYLVKTFSHNKIDKIDGSAFHGIRPIDVDESTDKRIIIDDLDRSFALDETRKKKSLWSDTQAAINASSDLDQGLPVGNGIPNVWSRRGEETAWGKYRRTVAYTKAGDGESKAVLSSELPNFGTWRLELHLPSMMVEPKPVLGNWELSIVSKDNRQNVIFDAKNSALGWNVVGNYELGAGEVRVEFSNKTDGTVVIADAIAWTPASYN